MKAPTPIDIATKTINAVFEILSSRRLTLYGEDDEGELIAHEDRELTECFELLTDCRLKLDRIAATKARKKDVTMKQREDEKTRKLREQLATAERDYIAHARVNPQSINDTQSHLATIDKIVRDMKRIRGRLGMHSKTDGFLKDFRRIRRTSHDPPTNHT